MIRDNKEYRILVVEDNIGDFVLIEEYLEEHTVAPKIDHATTFKEASEFLQNNEYDATFLDLTLPDKSGEDLIRQVVQLKPNSPIIVLTGYSDVSFSVKSLALGASDYLLKDDLNAAMLYKSLIYNIERQLASKNQRESERRYRELFHLSPQPMFVYDLDSLRFLDVNQAAIDNYGYSKEEFLQLDITDIRPEEDIPLLKKFLVEFDKTGQIRDFDKVRHKRKNGEVFYVNIKLSDLTYHGMRSRLVLASDVTEQQRYISAIEDQNKKLQEIAWIQSHKVRAPLARILSLIECYDIIDEEVMTRDEIHNHIIESAKELDDIIKSIMSKTEQIKIIKEKKS